MFPNGGHFTLSGNVPGTASAIPDKGNVDDEESQDLSNSMVNDLVAKILEEDVIVGDDVYATRYNGNSSLRYHPEAQMSQMSQINKIRSGANPCTNNDFCRLTQQFPSRRISSDISSIIENDREYGNICGGLNSLSLNVCTGLEKGNAFTNGFTNNSHHSEMHHHNLISSQQSPCTSRNYAPPSNGLLTTISGMDYGSRPANWTESILASECPKDLFGNYQQQMQSCPNTDYNFNVARNLALDSPDNVTLNDMQLHCNVGHNIPQNVHNNLMHNVHEAYNMTVNGQSYRPGSAMTDLSVDSGFLSNSPLQHFSPADSTLQNCFPNNYLRNNYEDFKDLHDAPNMNMSNMTPSNEHQLFLHHQSQVFKQDRAAEQNYKRFINRYSVPNEYAMPATNDLNYDAVLRNQDQRIENNLLKMLSPKTKSREKTVYSPIGFPRNLSSRNTTVEQSPTKYNYQPVNGYPRYVTNNGNSSKTVSPSANAMTYPNGLKRANTPCAAYKLPNGMPFPSNNHLAQQLASNTVDNNILNRIAKQRQRAKGMSAVPPAEVLFKGLMQGASGTHVFSSVMPMPVSMPVPPHHPMSVLFDGGLGLRSGNGTVKRTASSKILHLRLEQTYEQFKQLEKERKKCEAGLAAHFPGKKVTSANNIPTPRLQGSPSRVDRLIVDHMREHARVITLIAKMERLRGASMNQRIHKAMEHWLETIKIVQECRKQEIANGAKRQKENVPCMAIHDDRDILSLAHSIRNLTKASRYARTGMYNAMQATLLCDMAIEKKVVETSKDAIVALNTSERPAGDEVAESTDRT